MKMLLSFIGKLRDVLLINLVEWTKPPYARWFKQKQVAWQHNTDSLKRMPPKSLGYELGHFLEQEGLELLAKFEYHDVLHVLMNYQTTVVDEVRMQFFLLGNRRHSLYVFLSAMLGLCLLPSHYRSFMQDFEKGKKCVNISKWNFEYLLREPIDVLKKQIFKEKKKSSAPFIL